MKKVIVFVLAAVMLCSLAACGGETVSTGEKKVSVNTIEELEEIVQKDVADTVDGLRAEYDQLTAEIDTYDKYVKNTAKVNEFYNRINEENRAICIRMREYSITYTELVLKSAGSNSDKYDAIGDLYDCIYDDACGDIYDGIYDDLMGDMYDAIYDGVVEDGYDYAPYKEWSDTSSEAYKIWSDSLSDIYDEWSDALSDIYDFWSDVSSDLLDGDTDKVNEEITKFREDIDKLKEEK
ncbi:MAG: hypothetical protein Q4C46_07060 [Bacillota bacterium]|nr:hypothetical protein [Bacillota bacterium]